MLQYIILNIPFDIFSAIGAVSIIFGTFAVLLFKLLEEKYEKYKVKQMNKNMVDLNGTKPEQLKQSKNQQQQIKQEKIDENSNNKENLNKKRSMKNSILRIVFVKF
jgi:hypothetical protein